ncbi:MAG: ROK family transcriptional regulator [Pseudomonadota bacterium]
MTVAQTLGEVAKPRRLREMRDTERVILEAIRRQPDQSRAQLAARLDLSPALLSATVGAFLREGWITEQRVREPARRGQPALHLRLRPGAIAGIGVSLSTGGIRAAAMDLGGRVIQTVKDPIGAQDFEAGLISVEAALAHLFPAADCFAGITFWVPALINRQGEIEEVTPSQRGVDFMRYKRALEDRFGLPVRLESKCPAIDEAMYGSRPDALIFMLFLDYGVGGSLIDGLRVFRGANGMAVNIGALVPESGPRPSLPDLARCLGLADHEPGPDVFAALEAISDPRLRDWTQSRGRAMSDPLSIVVQFFNPTDIVLSGLFPKSVLERLAAEIDLGRYDVPGRVPMPKPTLRIARHVGEDALASSAAAVSLYYALSEPGG